MNYHEISNYKCHGFTENITQVNFYFSILCFNASTLIDYEFSQKKEKN